MWVRKLVSLHLLVATKEDHWFLLFNILRCPSGVGDWATELLQIPFGGNTATEATTSSRNCEMPLNINSPEMSNCIATLQILLLPIKKRNEYLKDFEKVSKYISIFTII